MTFRMSDLSDLARKRVAVAAYYFVPGLVFASWASRIPDVKRSCPGIEYGEKNMIVFKNVGNDLSSIVLSSAASNMLTASL